MKSLFNYIPIVILLITGCKFSSTYIHPTTNTSLNEELKDKSDIEEIISPYREGMSKAMDEVIGFSPMFLEKKKPTSILGSFMAEAVYQSANELITEKVDYCLLNYGGIRNTLDSGDITIGDIYEIMPFENEIAILTLSKVQMDSLFTLIEKKGGEPFVSHLEDKPGQDKYTYLIATNDYIANGGDNYALLTRAMNRIDTGVKVRDGLISYVKANNPLPLDYNTIKK